MVYSHSPVGIQLIPLEARNQLLNNAYKDGGKYLNLGCGKEYYDDAGWVNLDGDPNIKCDVVFDLDQKNITLPFKDSSFDIVWASHIFEHIWYLRDLKLDITRILKPGGQLTFIVPYYKFPDAWGDDTHCRAFSESSLLGYLWPGLDVGTYGYMPTINQDADGKPHQEYWLWASKPKLV